MSLNEVVKGLQVAQPYYFRACGQDTAAGSSATCGQARRFRTSPADSAISVIRPAHGNEYVNYVGAASVRHRVNFAISQAGLVADEKLDITTDQAPPVLGATFAPGAGCSPRTSAAGPVGYDNAAFCGFFVRLDVDATLGPYDDEVSMSAGDGSVSLERATVHLGGGADEFDFSDLATSLEVFGDAGPDVLRGGEGDDALRGGDGADLLFGGPGADLLDGGPGLDQYDCRELGGGADLVIADTQAEFDNAKAAGCAPVLQGSAAARAANRSYEARAR